MAQLIGEWKIESSENFDEYMKVMGESNAVYLYFLIYFFQYFNFSFFICDLTLDLHAMRET